MNDIRSLLKAAARRIELVAFVIRAHQIAVIFAAVALGLMLLDKVPAASVLPWMWVAPAMAVTGLLVAALLWARGRRSDLQVAMSVDERLELREKLSTALHCQNRQDAFAQAAIEDAVHTARDPRIREQVGRRFAIGAPRGWWISPVLVLAAVAASLLPQADLFARDMAPALDVVAAKKQADESIDALIKAIEDKPQLSSELSDLLGELTKEGTDPDALRSPQQVKRDAIKKVTDLNKRLDEIVNGEKGQTLEAMSRALAKLDTPEDGPAKDLADALARGDFSMAKKALDELRAKMQSGQLSDEQKKLAAEQLKNLAEQLEKLAQQQAQLEEALRQAGLDPQLAMNPEALKQALENNPNLNQQQIQQIQQMAQAQQAAASMCRGMGAACQAMAGGMMAGGIGQGGQAMGDQLSDLESLQLLISEAMAAAGACQGFGDGLGQGLSMEAAMQQWMASQGGAFGGSGRGAGGQAPRAPTPTRMKIQKAPIKTTEGPIIARQLVEGPQFVGESRQAVKEVVASIVEGYEEALIEEELPRKYHEAQKHYFGELENLTSAQDAPAEKVAESQEKSDDSGE